MPARSAAAAFSRDAGGFIGVDWATAVAGLAIRMTLTTVAKTTDVIRRIVPSNHSISKMVDVARKKF
jgi:hypothetical protein